MVVLYGSLGFCCAVYLLIRIFSAVAKSLFLLIRLKVENTPANQPIASHLPYPSSAYSSRLWSRRNHLKSCGNGVCIAQSSYIELVDVCLMDESALSGLQHQQNRRIVPAPVTVWECYASI